MWPGGRSSQRRGDFAILIAILILIDPTIDVPAEEVRRTEIPVDGMVTNPLSSSGATQDLNDEIVSDQMCGPPVVFKTQTTGLNIRPVVWK